ncbi:MULTISPECIES: type I DNA topoisomerase [unclassified Mycoplasma]|uniref:type I DNA topoisomerase n=1 Tax=unclassified Mycoplasma TaxID=2683645 RepID=UPI00211B93D7|nr:MULTISPECIES: type I DNA topoisomerase [unclassified Mycoplasma]UUM19589.1 type I DNA topoisomerase [Mycoplasma sp. 1578d]UUM24509.1 type I DNA topoisomerase [Mycoplasma sp. 3686d]
MEKNNLVIVESPNKVNTIKKYLGDNYEVVASVGHILKLKTSGPYSLGIDLQSWEPEYSLDSTKREVAKKLKESIKKSNTVYIATDPDREGEAIGEHLVNYFKLQDNYYRVKYNEITRDAILKAFEHPEKLNQPLVQAQKARRMMDRIIGFRLSSLMKNKIFNSPTNPSAGRVQSIALKLVVDREREIESFIPEYYSKLRAFFADNVNEANYVNLKNPAEKREWIFKEELENIKKYFESAPKTLIVSEVKQSQRKLTKVEPLKQSVLYKKSPYSAQVTQAVCQKLYEGYGEGGLISYPRTDSTRLSATFVNVAQSYINSKYGQEYVATEIKGFSGDQDAHEAIRPTDVRITPAQAQTLYPQMSEQELKIYQLIYEITLRSLMTPPVRKITSYTYLNGEYVFKNYFSKVVFDGYYIIDQEPPQSDIDPEYVKDQIISIREFMFEDHQTNPAPRYNEGSLIEKLDNIKVGRPSTFASTVKVIKDREYVEVFENTLKPTEFGIIVLDKLISSFPKIINESYTASVEEQLDQIAEDKLEKNNVMQDFWDRFTEELEQAQQSMQTSKIEQVELDEPCPDDQGILIERRNKQGQKFIGCKNFPQCRYTRSIPSQKTFKFSRRGKFSTKKEATE